MQATYSIKVTTAVVAGLVFLGNLQSSVCGQVVTRIEEDWVVEVVDPDDGLTAPQFTSVMTPDQDDPSSYFTIEFNHSTDGDFVGGGLQLQAWQSDALAEASDRLSEEVLRNNDERIFWTQYMETSSAGIEFGLSSLSSRTWNDVDLSEAKLVVASSSVSNLNHYRLVDSTSGSGVGYAANRVGDMILIEVRAYAGDQLVQRVEVNHYLKRRGRE